MSILDMIFGKTKTAGKRYFEFETNRDFSIFKFKIGEDTSDSLKIGS